MPAFYPLTICRSDGQPEIPLKGGSTELNGPTAAQTNDTPKVDGTVDCYRKLDGDDEKVLEWRRKLGGMTMRLLGGKAHADRNYILSELPDGYTLWEHLKYKVDKGSRDKKRERGKHSAESFERQDTYLYGHPQGRKKRYRSPADFFPHLLWLITDSEGEYANCTCKICSPEQIMVAGAIDVNKQEFTKPEMIVSIKKETNPKVVISSAIRAPSSKPTSQNYSLVPNLSVTAARQIQSAEQRQDSQANTPYLFRPGELVWFKKGQNWGLGVIVKRKATMKILYVIQPLSDPYHHPQCHIKDQGDSIRPWLAWSVPQPSNERLKNVSFDAVPWDKVRNGDFGRFDPEVDGSILASKDVDASYSFFDRIDNALVGPGEVSYVGMFLGAEKIWVGEPVRLRRGDDIVILIVQKLIEKATPSGPSSVTFVGDVYKFVEMPTPYKNRSEWPTANLPPRMVADLRFRNEVADNSRKGIWYEWRLLEPAAKLALADVKGRWYETRTLLPILKGDQQFQMDISHGLTNDAGLWMNGRGDNSVGPPQRKKNRKETFGRAVPDDFKVSRGLDGPPADDVFPDLAAGKVSEGFTEGDIMARYVDLDQEANGQW